MILLGGIVCMVFRCCSWCNDLVLQLGLGLGTGNGYFISFFFFLCLKVTNTFVLSSMPWVIQTSWVGACVWRGTKGGSWDTCRQHWTSLTLLPNLRGDFRLTDLLTPIFYCFRCANTVRHVVMWRSGHVTCGDVTKWSGRQRISAHELVPNKISQRFSLQCLTTDLRLVRFQGNLR